jgi:predicted nucleotide-binding protein
MAKINQDLLKAIIGRTGLSRPAVYARIQRVSTSDYLPSHLAAIKVGADEGLAINRYATQEELAQLRQAGAPVAPPAPPTTSLAALPAPAKARSSPKSGKKAQKVAPNQVFVVYGRDLHAKSAMFSFIRALGVKPIEWASAIAMSGKAAPYVGDILEAAFAQARAIVVLLTPDDLAQLRGDLLLPSDPPYERRLMGQARPNVLFECGMAFSSHPDRTVMVQIGNVRPFSDTFGRHVVHMNNDYSKRQELATKLRNAGCDVDTNGNDWVAAGDFTDPEARSTASRRSTASSKQKRT